MNRELAVYLRLQAVIAAAYNFFISGMIAALIYHKADFVPTDTISIAIDITITCLMTFAITTPFCRSSLRRDKTGGVLAAKTPPARLLAWLSRCPVLMVISLSLCAMLILFALTASFFALLGVTAVPFYLYIALKSVFSAALGAFATCAVLYAGMCGAG
ncbi:MAG: hypothetical protein AAGU27_13860 [Dehalobacterium sp.]